MCDPLYLKFIFNWVKSRISGQIHLSQMKAERLAKLKQEIREHLFYMRRYIDFEIEHYEMTFIFDMDKAFIEGETRGADKVYESYRVAILELEKIITVQEVGLADVLLSPQLA